MNPSKLSIYIAFVFLLILINEELKSQEFFMRAGLNFNHVITDFEVKKKKGLLAANGGFIYEYHFNEKYSLGIGTILNVKGRKLAIDYNGVNKTGITIYRNYFFYFDVPFYLKTNFKIKEKITFIQSGFVFGQGLLGVNRGRFKLDDGTNRSDNQLGLLISQQDFALQLSYGIDLGRFRPMLSYQISLIDNNNDIPYTNKFSLISLNCNMVISRKK